VEKTRSNDNKNIKLQRYLSKTAYKLHAKLKIFTLLLLLPLTFLGQEKQNVQKLKKEVNQYIQEEDTTINFKFSFYNLNQEFKISGDNFLFKIQPNFALKTRFFVNYKFISLAIAIAPKFIPGNSDSELRGKTKSFTLNLNLFTNHWVQEFQFNKTKGFYLSNTADYKLPDWIEGKDPYIQFPNMKLITLRGATSYLFNSNFSLKAIRAHTAIQKKSAGSFMPSLIYSFYSITNDAQETQSHQNSYNFEVLGALWYMHTFVIHKNWFFSGGISPSVGYSFTKLNTYLGKELVTTHYKEPIFRLNEQISLGINYKRFFTGVQFLAYQTKQSQGSQPVKQNNYYVTFQVFAGYRFNAPKFLKKNAH
jgi:hypothetical protein